MKTSHGGLLADPLRRVRHKCFDEMRGELEHERNEMCWPSEAQASGRSYIGNNMYRDMRGTTWDEARRMRDAEARVIETWEDQGGWSARAALFPCVQGWSRVAGGMDLGVTSATWALAAAGGVPMASCNGGAFGGKHIDDMPCIAVWWRLSTLDALVDCVVQTGMTTWMSRHGTIVIGADYVRKFLILADALHERRDLFDGNAPRKEVARGVRDGVGQAFAKGAVRRARPGRCAPRG